MPVCINEGKPGGKMRYEWAHEQGRGFFLTGEMTTHEIDFSAFEARAATDHWIFGDHLRRILTSLAHDPALGEAVRAVLQGQPCPTLDSFFRLRSAGVVSGLSEEDARLRCPLYAAYLGRHLGSAPSRAGNDHDR